MTVATKTACLIINGYFIIDHEYPVSSELPNNWYWATPPVAVGGYQFVTLDDGKSWYATKDRGYGKPTYVAPEHLTLGQYRDRFTFAERVAIDNAPDNVALPADVRWAVRTINIDFSMAKYIDRDNPQTIVCTQILEQFGLLQPGRANQILDAA